MLIGNLGKDPEVQTLSGNIKLAKFSLANTETYRDDKRQTHALDDKQGIKRVCDRNHRGPNTDPRQKGTLDLRILYGGFEGFSAAVRAYFVLLRIFR